MNLRIEKIDLMLVAVLGICLNVTAQTNTIYEKLPVGKYAVGFKIVTLIDETRITKPEYNYLGEKNEGDRRKQITIHIWYPAKANSGQKKLVYEDYCYNHLLKATNQTVKKDQQDGEVSGKRRSVENWFGKTTDSAWRKLTRTVMLAQADAEPVRDRFPLLVGMLRNLSTSVTNEMLASNGYVVAMIQQGGFSSFALAALDAIPDMRFAIGFLEKKENIDNSKIGTFGFSGSGFSQVLFAMNEYRVKAVADIESGIYMDGLFQNFSASNYYTPDKLRAPFLHIFSRDLSKQEKFIGDFETKTIFTKRYRLLLNQPALHHWDFASEGYTAAIFLNNRGDQAGNIRQSFEIASFYLLNFFNAELKKDVKAISFLSAKPALKEITDSLWDISVLTAAKPAPDNEAFKYIIETKGIDQAIAIVRNTIKDDTLTDIRLWYNLNGLGYSYLNKKKYKEAIQIFKLNTELHPEDANLFDSLAEGYELSGDKENMTKVSLVIMEMLTKKENLSASEKGLKGNAEKRLQ